MSIIITTATDYVFTIIARHFDKCSAYTLPSKPCRAIKCSSKPCRAIVIIIPISQMNRLLIYMPVSLGERTTARIRKMGVTRDNSGLSLGQSQAPGRAKEFRGI